MKNYLSIALVALVAIAAVPASALIVTNMVPLSPADAFPASGLAKTFVLEGTVDLAAQYNSGNGTTNAAAGQVAVIKVPSGAYVMAVSSKVISYPAPATAAYTNAYSVNTTYDVGDGDSANNWIALAALTNGIAASASTPVFTITTNATATVWTNSVAPTSAMGKFYTTTQNLNVRFTAAPGISGVVRVKAFCVKFD